VILLDDPIVQRAQVRDVENWAALGKEGLSLEQVVHRPRFSRVDTTALTEKVPAWVYHSLVDVRHTHRTELPRMQVVRSRAVWDEMGFADR